MAITFICILVAAGPKRGF